MGKSWNFVSAEKWEPCNNQQLYIYDITINNRSNLMHKPNYGILEHVACHRRTSG